MFIVIKMYFYYKKIVEPQEIFQKIKTGAMLSQLPALQLQILAK